LSQRSSPVVDVVIAMPRSRFLKEKTADWSKSKSAAGGWHVQATVAVRDNSPTERALHYDDGDRVRQPNSARFAANWPSCPLPKLSNPQPL